MSNLVSFKVYLNKNTDEGVAEVRRLGIEENTATNYSYFIEKLKTVFPCLQNANYPLHLYWKDSDNDEVMISSDDELIIALTEMNESLKKIFIKAAPATCQENIEASEEYHEGDGDRSDLHPGVICDGCDGVVVGFRYKCVQCPDFDLCSSCETKRLHPEHLMLRIATPINRISGVKICACSGKKRGKCCCDASERGVTRDIFVDNLNFPFLRRYSKKNYKHNGHKLSTACPIADSIAKSLANKVLFGDAMGQQATEGFTSQEGPCIKKCKRNAQSSSNPTSSKMPQNSGLNSSGTAAEASATSPTTSAAQPQGADSTSSNNSVQPRNIIDLMTVAFDCLLKQDNPITDFINDIISENMDKSKHGSKSENNNNNDSPNTASSEEQAQNVKMESQDDKQMEKGNAASAEKVGEGNAPDIKVENEKINTVFTITSSNGEGASTTRHIKIETSDVDKLVHDIEKMAVKTGTDNDQPLTATAPHIKEFDSKETQLKDDGIRVKAITEDQKETEDGWTLLNEQLQQSEKPKSDTDNSSTGAIPKTTYKDTENAQHQPSNTGIAEPSLSNAGHVSDSLRRMLAMGFTNEGNWLGDLLMRNNGDVAAVLDLLLPAKRNTF